MDRLDAMAAFVATVDAGGLSAAARRLSRSPASVTRAVAALEELTGAELLRRTTRTLKLTAAGTRYLAACRRILADVAEAEQAGEGERDVARGLLTVTAPALFGRLHVRSIVDAFLAANGEARARLLLLDRVVSLVDEGVDVAVRIAHMPDSALVATKVGEVRRVTVASPRYVARHGAPATPADLPSHACIAFSQVSPGESWTFAGGGGGRSRHVRVRARLSVNTAEAAIASALDGHGITRVLSYQVAREIREGRLVRLLAAFEPEPLPVHLVAPSGSAATARVRRFLDLAVPRLRAAIASPRGEIPASAP